MGNFRGGDLSAWVDRTSLTRRGIRVIFEQNFVGDLKMGPFISFVLFLSASAGTSGNPADVPRKFGSMISSLRPFGLEVLERTEVEVAWRGWRVRARKFGDERYGEFQVALDKATSLGRKVKFGLRLRAVAVDMEGFGRRMGICLDLGLSGALSGGWSLGLSAGNPLGSKVGGERLSQDLRMEVSYAGDVKLKAGVEKEVHFPPIFWAEVAYPAAEGLCLYTGASGQEVWAGVGVSLGRFLLVYRTGYHQALGTSQGICLGYGYDLEEVRDLRL